MWPKNQREGQGEVTPMMGWYTLAAKKSQEKKLGVTEMKMLSIDTRERSSWLKSRAYTDM